MQNTLEEVRSVLNRPNGPAQVDPEKAWEALAQLVLQEEDGAALSVWVQAAKQKKYREKLLDLLDSETMQRLLQSESPKTRKNAARLAGALGRREDAQALKQALSEEETRMVRPSQILALGALGEEDFLRQYQVPSPRDASEEKHARKEQEALTTALAALTSITRHKVRGLPRNAKIELVVPDELEKQTLQELKSLGMEGTRAARGRVQLELSSYKSLLNIRSWREMLFPLVTFQAPPEKWARIIADRAGEKFIHLLETVYAGDPPYAYRIELKGNLDRGQVSRQIAAALGSEKLVNAPSDYETELRVEQHGRSATVYARFCTLPDARFSYRKGAIAASIHPSVAAGVMQWASPYFLPRAKVLDPCCGSGTMLVERAKYDTVSTLFGIDISEQAIRIAEGNLEAAGLEAKLIVKNCTMFTAKDKFDEVISNLPFGNRVGDHETNLELYDALFAKLPQWLRAGGIAVFYTMEVRLVKQMLRKYASKLMLKAQIRTEAGGLDPGIFIIEVR